MFLCTKCLLCGLSVCLSLTLHRILYGLTFVMVFWMEEFFNQVCVILLLQKAEEGPSHIFDSLHLLLYGESISFWQLFAYTCIHNTHSLSLSVLSARKFDSFSIIFFLFGGIFHIHSSFVCKWIPLKTYNVPIMFSGFTKDVNVKCIIKALLWWTNVWRARWRWW